MERKELYEALKKRFPEDIGDLIEDEGDVHVLVNAAALEKVCAFAKEDPEIDLNYLSCISSFDLLKLSGATDEQKGCLGVVYHLESFELETGQMRHDIQLRVIVPREEPDVPSVAGIWETANWHEREAFDLMGIRFPGHPDLRRILTDDDWVGHPLRKDYVFPTEYRGIDLT